MIAAVHGTPRQARAEPLRKDPQDIVAEQIDFQERAALWVREQYGEQATIAGFGPMPGNSGLSFGFRICAADGTLVDEVVVRLAPPGVKRSGNTDVLRQVPLLTTLERTDVPIAPLTWYAAEAASPFGTDAIVQRRMPGRSLSMFHRAEAPVGGRRTTEQLVDKAVGALVQVHQVDASSLTGEWDDVVPVDQDLAYWFRLIEKVDDSDLLELGSRLRSAIIEQQPADDRQGIYHGDYQTNNVLFGDDGEVSAIVDWEIAGIGYVGLDVGWMSMMLDPTFWGAEHRRRMQIRVEPEAIRESYEKYAGAALPHFEWYRAYSGYRFGAIAAYNLRLHRTGRRPDPVYEVMATSIPQLFNRGLEVIGRR